jgi:glycosyltransferase involved in cell wall biosynthesis
MLPVVENVTDQTSSPPDLSIVVPLFDEEANIGPFLDELFEVLSATDLEFEAICVDDGSSDRTFELLRTRATSESRLRVLRFGKNYGQTAAMSAGFHAARAPVVVTLDGDQQNDPHDIPRLLDRFNEGFDVVSGWRRARKDGFVHRTLPSRMANLLISRITGVHLHDYGCTLKAYSKEVLDRFELYGQLHRFIPALAAWSGGRITEVEVNHRPRSRGQTKYGIGRTLTVLLDLTVVKFLMSYGSHPIRAFGMVGFLSWLVALGSLIAVIIMKVWQQTDMTGNPLLYLAILGVMVGLQFILMGVIAEMLMRTYHEAQNKRPYIIVEELN